MDLEELRKLTMDNLDMLIECGFNIPVTKLVLSDKVNIIQTVTLHKVILVSLAELSQFCDGLSSLGVLDALKNHSELLSSFYCQSSDVTLTAGTTHHSLVY